MTVPANINRWQYAGNDSGTTFAYTAKVFAKTDMVVTRTSAAGVDTLLVVDVDFTVTGVGEDDGGDVVYPISGAPLPTGETLTIERVLPLTQLLDLRNQGAWLPENHEHAYDRLTMIAQQHDDALVRSLRFPATDAPGLSAVIPNVAARANKLLAFDSNGLPIASGGSVSGAIPVSVFAETLLDDANAPAFLTTLGFPAFIQSLLNDVDAATARATLAAMEQVLTTRGDLVRAGAAGVPQRVALSAVTEAVLMSNTVDALWGLPTPTGYRHGLELSRVAAFDVQVGTGVAKAAADTWSMRLAAALVKQLDAVWSAGTNQGGRPAAVALAANTWYHVFLIFNAGTGVVDAGFDTSPTAANLLAASGFGHYRRLGSVLSNSGATDIIDFFQSGPHFWWKDTAIDQSATFAGPGVLTFSLRVPPDIKPGAFGTIVGDGGGDAGVLVSSLDGTDETPDDALLPLATLRATNQVADVQMAPFGPVRVSTARLVRVRANAAIANVRLLSRGWIDPLP